MSSIVDLEKDGITAEDARENLLEDLRAWIKRRAKVRMLVRAREGISWPQEALESYYTELEQLETVIEREEQELAALPAPA